MLSALIAGYGYWGLTLGVFLEGEAVLMGAGALAHDGVFRFPAVLACALLGSMCWDQLWFELGRRFESALLRARPRWHERAAQVQPWLRERTVGFVFCYRFIAGMGTLGPFLVGASTLPRWRYAPAAAAGAACWAVTFGGTGWIIGAGIHELVGRIQAWQTLVSSMVGGMLGAWALTWIARRLRASHALKKPRHT
jgi:membrane protein DedA with SNARE-associated domain